MDKIDRRKFLKGAAVVTGSAVLGGSVLSTEASAAAGHADPATFAKNFAILYDASKCIGCRICEKACNTTNNLKQPDEPFDDLSVLNERRRTDESTHTVINKFHPSGDSNESPVFVKYQCMHCNEPACVSACIVEALRKQPDGIVHYEAAACIGCRYCMIACPFLIPVYEYDKPLFPLVLKCTLCEHRVPGKVPACVESCPQEAMLFGRREDIIDIGHKMIDKNPEKYHKELFGEHVIGGTSWIYLLPAEPTKLGFRDLGTEPAPKLSETIQHSIFSYYFAAPIILYLILGAMLMRSHRKEEIEASKHESGGEE